MSPVLIGPTPLFESPTEWSRGGRGDRHISDSRWRQLCQPPGSRALWRTLAERAGVQLIWGMVPLAPISKATSPGSPPDLSQPRAAQPLRSTRLVHQRCPRRQACQAEAGDGPRRLLPAPRSDLARGHRARAHVVPSSECAEGRNQRVAPTLTLKSERPAPVADTLSPARRSWNMSRIKARDTHPERVVRSVLHGLGFRFRLHGRALPGRPDVVLPKYRAVVFVHGCFWHRHQRCAFAYNPKSNVDFWTKKFAENVERDQRKARALRASGWKVITVWECQTRDRKRLTARLDRLVRLSP